MFRLLLPNLPLLFSRYGLVIDLWPRALDLNHFVFLQVVSDSKGPSENVCVSPFSVAAILSMTHVGAEGNTAQQIRNTLHLKEHTVDQISLSVGKLCLDTKVLYFFFHTGPIIRFQFFNPILFMHAEWWKMHAEDSKPAVFSHQLPANRAVPVITEESFWYFSRKGWLCIWPNSPWHQQVGGRIHPRKNQKSYSSWWDFEISKCSNQ